MKNHVENEPLTFSDPVDQHLFDILMTLPSPDQTPSAAADHFVMTAAAAQIHLNRKKRLFRLTATAVAAAACFVVVPLFFVSNDPAPSETPRYGYDELIDTVFSAELDLAGTEEIPANPMTVLMADVGL